MNRDEYYLGIAAAVAAKSPCLRKHYGAVIVSKGEIIATGYNGPPRGEAHCQTCTKKDVKTSCGAVIDESGHNKDYLEYLTCPSVHAEQNAIISAARKDMLGSTLYLYGIAQDVPLYTPIMLNPRPCEICWRLIKNAGIARVITLEGVIYENKTY